MDRVQSGLAYALLVPAGVLAGHEIGYATAGSHGGADQSHGYLPSVAKGALALVAIAVVWSLLDRKVVAGLSLRRLFLLQWAAFAGQETVEHLLAGDGVTPLVTSAPLWFGLLAQVMVAAGTALLLRSAATAGSRLLSAARPAWPALARSSLYGPTPALPARRRARPACSAAPRGPPLLAA